MNATSTGRTNQKVRTRTAIVEACRQLVTAGTVVTMPEVARLALVSEATAYRYFPDLASLVNEVIADLWPSPAEALASIATSTDPVERIAVASEVFLRRVLALQGSVRAMIAATIIRPETVTARPGLRFAWIAYALAPAEAVFADASAFAQLKQDLAVIVSPESLFTQTDLCGLTPTDAVANCVRMATTITEAALRRAAL
jgi:AcrR family transcriptional regulator